MNEIDVWNNGERYDFKKSEIKVFGDDRVRITRELEEIKGYNLKYILPCMDQNFITFKEYFYEKIK